MNGNKIGSSDLDSSSLARNGALEKNAPKGKPKMAETWGEMIRAWPKITFCVVVNEFCERFSYYGMRTVLTLYILNILKYSENDSSTFFNAFSALCYFWSIFGAVLADGWLGKFKTIVTLSIFYAIGQVLLALVSTRSKGSGLHPLVDFAGLLIIALGTGGIKPCVSPFGGDQFEPHETRMISMFFSFFYFSINAGAMISTFVTPVFRATPCLEQDTCYPLAFGMPAVLMIVATCVFISGSFWYKKKPPESNVFKDVAVVVKKAVSNKMRSGEKKEHWLDHALDTHTCEYSDACQKRKRRIRDPSACAKAKFVEDVKSLFRVLIMYIPLPIFWSLYDQQASTWTLQAVYMDSRLGSKALMLPDQMQVLNAVLILAFIPLFQAVVYPLFGKCFKVTPLRKMVAGGLLAGFSFLIAAFVQLLVNKTLPMLPPNGHSYVSVINTLDNCNVTATAVGYQPEGKLLLPHTALINTHNDVQHFEVNQGEVKFQFNYTGTGCLTNILPTQANFNVSDGRIFYIHVSEMGMFCAPVTSKKPTEGTGEFSTGIVAALSDKNYDGNFAFCKMGAKDTNEEQPCNPKQKADFYFFSANYSTEDGKVSDRIGKFPYLQKNGATSDRYATVFKVKSVRPGEWRLYYMDGNSGKTKDDIKVAPTGVGFTRREQGGVYLNTLTGPTSKPVRTEFQVVPDNAVSILWQIPQIVVITAGEILFSITGLEFSYTQAAPSMKAVVGACFLLTVGVGDTLIVVINLIHFTDNYAVLFLVYAIIMATVMLIFALMCIFYYEYANYTEAQDGNKDEDEGDQWNRATDEEHSNASTMRPILYDADFDPKTHEWKVKL